MSINTEKIVKLTIKLYNYSWKNLCKTCCLLYSLKTSNIFKIEKNLRQRDDKDFQLNKMNNKIDKFIRFSIANL